jgi:hypothetical protein
MTETRQPTAEVRRHLSPGLLLVAVTLALLVAELPLIAAVILLGSVVIHRPLLVRFARRLGQSTALLGGAAGAERNQALGRATLASGLTLLLIGAAQALGAARFGLSITTASGILARTALALVAEAALALAIVSYLKRRPR